MEKQREQTRKEKEIKKTQVKKKKCNAKAKEIVKPKKMNNDRPWSKSIRNQIHCTSQDQQNNFELQNKKKSRHADPVRDLWPFPISTGLASLGS